MSYRPWLLIDASAQPSNSPELAGISLTSLPLKTSSHDYAVALGDLVRRARVDNPLLPVALLLEGVAPTKDALRLQGLPIMTGNSNVYLVPEGRRGIVEFIEKNKKIVESLKPRREARSCG